MQKKELPSKTEQQQKMERIAQFDAYFKDLDGKFQEMTKQVNEMPKNIEIFKNHQLPLARIKKIMKSDEDVRMISSETPVLFAKACEIFITELTYRAWAFTLQSKRRTLQKSDVSACIYHTEIFDFLIDIIPKQDMKLLKKTTPDNVFQILQNQQQSKQQKKVSQEELDLNNK